jgi:hypothetical protein
VVRKALQVRLEIYVITNFAINLQAISLAFGHDNAVGLWIEVNRRREAETPFGLQTPRPSSRLHHVGVGVDALLAPLRHHLGITDEIRNRVALGVEDAHPVITPIRHIDIAIGIDSDVGGVIEQTGFDIARRT